MAAPRNRTPRVRTLKAVERDLKRARRAERRLRHDWDVVTRDIAASGGLVSGNDPKDRRVSPLLRQQRELDKARKIQAAEIKQLNAELVALEAQAKDKPDEYAL
jgi:DNA-binding helix-hairpin-helix protein with protein kinase domain